MEDILETERKSKTVRKDTFLWGNIYLIPPR